LVSVLEQRGQGSLFAGRPALALPLSVRPPPPALARRRRFAGAAARWLLPRAEPSPGASAADADSSPASPPSLPLLAGTPALPEAAPPPPVSPAHASPPSLAPPPAPLPLPPASPPAPAWLLRSARCCAERPGASPGGPCGGGAGPRDL
jgi:hypothetical protein